MPRNRSLFSGRSKSTTEAPENEVDSVSRASAVTPNGRAGAASLPRDFNADAANQQRRPSLRHSLGRTLSSLFSSSSNPSKQQQQFQQQQMQQYLEQQQQLQQQQQIQHLLEQQQLQQQQMNAYLEHQQQQQQQILSYLQEQRQSGKQPEMLVYYDKQQPEDPDASGYEQPNTAAASSQDQLERQRLQQRLVQQQQQLQQLALRANQQQPPSPQTPPQPRQADPRRQQPPLLQQHSEPSQRRQQLPPNQQPPLHQNAASHQPPLQHQLSEPHQPRRPQVQPQSSKEQRAPTPPQRRLQLRHQPHVADDEELPRPRGIATLPRSDPATEGRPGLRRIPPQKAPQRQFSSPTDGAAAEGRVSRPRAQDAPAIRLRRSKNSEARPQSCSRASSRSEANSSESGPTPARSFSNIKTDTGGSSGDMQKIRFSSTFIRKSVGDDLYIISPTSDSTFVVCDIPDGSGEDPDSAGLAHFVTLRKSKKKGLQRNESTVERKEAYGKEKPPARPISVSLSSNSSGGCTRHQKKAPTMLMDNL